MLDERVGKPIQHENCVGRVRKSWKKSLIGIKLSSNTKFPHPTRFSIFSQILRSAKPIQHFIQHAENAMLDEMLDWFASALKREQKFGKLQNKLSFEDCNSTLQTTPTGSAYRKYYRILEIL